MSRCWPGFHRYGPPGLTHRRPDEPCESASTCQLCDYTKYGTTHNYVRKQVYQHWSWVDIKKCTRCAHWDYDD
jgi:hypothetical protein